MRIKLVGTLAATVIVLGGSAASAVAQSPPEKIGTVEVTVEKNITEFGRLHIAAALLGYQLSNPDGGPVSTIGAFYELAPRVFVDAHATLPLLGVVGGDTAPYRLEAGAMLFVKDAFELEDEEIIISQTLATEDRDGEKVFTKARMINRNRAGLDAKLMFAHATEKVLVAGSTSTQPVTSNALIAAIGLGAIGSTGFSVNVEGHGKRSNYRWNAGGLDALVDLTRTYETDPSEKGSRFGGRLWAETIWFRTFGMSARAEIGKYPGHAGWVLVASLGGSLHAM